MQRLNSSFHPNRVALGILLVALAVLPMKPATAGDLDPLLCNQINLNLLDCVDLINLYTVTDGDNWTNNSGWGTLDIDSWFGVFVDFTSRRVISIDLAINNLDGRLPNVFNGLSELDFLQLSSNKLRGQIPASIGDLQSLTLLQIGFNQLDGAIPDEIGQLSLLENLDLTFNRLSGQLPASLGQLGRLERLALGLNSFDGVVPPELGNLTALRELDLSATAFSRGFIFGTLPDTLARTVQTATASL